MKSWGLCNVSAVSVTYCCPIAVTGISVTYCCPSHIPPHWSQQSPLIGRPSRQTTWVSPSSISVLTSDRWNCRRLNREWHIRRERQTRESSWVEQSGKSKCDIPARRRVTHEVFLSPPRGGRRVGEFSNTYLISPDRQAELSFPLWHLLGLQINFSCALIRRVTYSLTNSQQARLGILIRFNIILLSVAAFKFSRSINTFNQSSSSINKIFEKDFIYIYRRPKVPNSF